MQRRLPRRTVGVLVAALVAAVWTVPPAGAQDRSPAPEAPGAPTGRQQPPRVQPGQLLVKHAAGGRGLERALAAVSGRQQRALGRALHVVQVPQGTEYEAAQRLTADPAVEYAEPNYFRQATSHVGEVGWGVSRVRAPELWGGDSGVTGLRARIAIIDSGVAANHADLEGRVLRGYDAYNTRGRDECGHGTAVAGVAAADHDGQGLAGVAPEASIVPVKVLTFSPLWGVCGSGDAELIDGINWVADGHRGWDRQADIINLSLSGPERSRALGEAVDYATSKGVLVIGAAGNDGNLTVNYPAAYRNVISVGGVERGREGLRWWPHSSFGAVDVVAPARSIPVIQSSDEVAMGQPCTIGTADHLCADGTSFAAPHVAGVAALLSQRREAELAAMSPRARVRSLRQWLVATAADVEGTPAVVDLKTGHGLPDAVAADTAGGDGGRTLLSWQVEGRILAPWRRMAAAPLWLHSRLVVTNGRGNALPTTPVAFTPSPGASVTSTTVQTNSEGHAATELRSGADGRISRLTAKVGDAALRMAVYVLDRDDNVPGVAPPRSPVRDSLNLADDFDDVFRLRLRDGETMRANVGRVSRREDVAVYLHRGSTSDISNPRHAPLREDSQAYEDNWTRLKVTVRSDGVRYLHTNGYGTYRMRWWIVSPGKIRNAGARPSTFTPNGDGYRDRTRVSWRNARAGTVKVRIRNGAGRVVKRANLGRLGGGVHRIHWNGRNNRGRVVRQGRYRIVLRWADGNGRVSSTSTRVTVSR